MKKEYLSFILCLSVLLGFCMRLNAQIPGKTSYGDAIQNINYHMRVKDYRGALDMLNQVYKKDSLNGAVNLKIGICRFELKQSPDTVLPWLLKAKAEKQIDAAYYLGQVYHLNQAFKKEINEYQQYENSKGKKQFSNTETNRMIAIAQRAENMIKHPLNIDVENIGPSINTQYPEYVPLISTDDSTLIFTSRRPGSTGGKIDAYGSYYEDIYIAYRQADGWSKPQNMGPPINTATHDACVSLSTDGQTLFIYRTNKDMTGGDLYSSMRQKGDKWSDPVKLGPQINTKYLEPSACLSPDSQILYFSSNRPGGYGGKDLYKVVRLPNGKWSLPSNLGPTINTPYDEDAPFIFADGKTLYFSSQGHATMGGYDIFRSTMQSNGLWTLPQNMGYPINTVRDDIFFTISADKEHAYFSSDRPGGYGASDIYMANLKNLQNAFVVVHGSVVAKDSTHTTLKASLTLIDEDMKTLNGIYASNPYNGKYILVCNPNDKYKVFVEADGYYPISREIDFSSTGNLTNSLMFNMIKK